MYNNYRQYCDNPATRCCDSSVSIGSCTIASPKIDKGHILMTTSQNTAEWIDVNKAFTSLCVSNDVIIENGQEKISIKKQLSKLEKRIQELEESMLCPPGGPIYDQAKKKFEENQVKLITKD